MFGHSPKSNKTFGSGYSCFMFSHCHRGVRRDVRVLHEHFMAAIEHATVWLLLSNPWRCGIVMGPQWWCWYCATPELNVRHLNHCYNSGGSDGDGDCDDDGDDGITWFVVLHSQSCVAMSINVLLHTAALWGTYINCIPVVHAANITHSNISYPRTHTYSNTWTNKHQHTQVL